MSALWVERPSWSPNGRQWDGAIGDFILKVCGGFTDSTWALGGHGPWRWWWSVERKSIRNAVCWDVVMELPGMRGETNTDAAARSAAESAVFEYLGQQLELASRASAPKGAP